MKKIIFGIAAAALALSSCCQNKVAPAIPSDPQMEKEIKKIIKNMTLEEKVGQMCELTIGVLQDWSKGPAAEFSINEEALDKIIGEYKVGSILNVPQDIAQTPEKWQEVITRIQEKSMEVLGIPDVYGVDQNHGTTYTQGGTLFPQPINIAATFNREHAYNGAVVTAYESKATSIPWLYNPVTDLGRDPRWPRMWESFGEDSYLNGQMGAAVVKGYQGDDPNHIGEQNVAACMKHFMGYGVPRTGKDRTPAQISPADLREKYFAPYVEMIKAGALSVMINSASINGVPVHANYELLTGWLKESLNWDGMIVTDWADINNLYQREKVAKDKKEAIKIAINAGIDMSMDPYDPSFCPLLVELVKEGEVPMSRIDDAVARILRLKMRLNLWEKPYYNLEDFPLFGSKEHADVALAAAEESIVLLKNEGLLPLAQGKKILVTGPNANSMRCLNGGWSYTWQGSNAEHLATQYNTILEALQNKNGASNIIYEPGVQYNFAGNYYDELTPEIDKAVKAAAKADVIVACVGETSYCETVGNLDDLALSENQRNLVKALAKTGKPIILVLNEGRPRLINDIEPLAGAIVDAMLPGNYGADALANLLAGDVNFSAKLPFNYPKTSASLVTYDYKVAEHTGAQMEGAYNYEGVVNVQWAFGYGKSYTSYAYSNLTVNKTEFNSKDELTFTVDVTNTGKVAGKESVLLFSSDLVASITPDNRRLRGFEKVALEPGETKTVSITIPASDLAFVNYEGKWTIEKGEFRMQMGDQVVMLNCTETKVWKSANI